MEIERQLDDLTNLIKAWIDTQNADGCKGCAYDDVEEWQMPCKRCKRNCKDYWREPHEI